MEQSLKAENDNLKAENDNLKAAIAAHGNYSLVLSHENIYYKSRHATLSYYIKCLNTELEEARDKADPWTRVTSSSENSNHATLCARVDTLDELVSKLMMENDTLNETITAHELTIATLAVECALCVVNLETSQVDMATLNLGMESMRTKITEQYAELGRLQDAVLEASIQEITEWKEDAKHKRAKIQEMPLLSQGTASRGAQPRVDVYVAGPASGRL